MPTVTDSTLPAARRGELFFWYAAVFVAAMFMAILHLSGNEPFRLTTFHQLVNFQAVEPFQHRILLPAIVVALQTFLPVGEKLLFGVLEMFGWMALILVAHRALTLFDIGRSARIRRVLAFTVLVPMYAHLMLPDLLLVPTFVIHEPDHIFQIGQWDARPLFYYVYDLPAALFTFAMTLLLVCHVRAPSPRYLVAYFLLFVLATFNRETSAFMISFFALLFVRKMPWPQLLALLALQCALYMAILLPLHWLFAGQANPQGRLAGSSYESHMLLNLGILFEPAFFVTFLARFAAGLWLPVLLWHRALDRRLAIALIGFGLPLILFAMLGGIIREYRIFIEIVPLIWLAALQVIAAPSVRSPPATR